MENNVDRYTEVIKDLLFIANARVEVKAATNRLKKNLTVHELSENPCCNRDDAKYALNKILNDDLIGEVELNQYGAGTRLKYNSLVAMLQSINGSGAGLIGELIRVVGKKTIMEDAL